MRFPTTSILLLSTVSSVKGLGGYSSEGSNLKCPYQSSTRLFRTPGQTLDECSSLCYNTDGCNYFSIGVTDYPGVCIGCTGDASLATHHGFHAYVLIEFSDSTVDFPTPAPTPESSKTYELEALNKKCPGTRLFRTSDNNPLSKDECYEMCKSTSGCTYFTLGENVRDNWKGVCMGCTADVTLADHSGFNSYVILP